VARLAFKWVWKKNKAAPSGTRIPGHPARSSVTTLTELHHSSVTINCAVEHHTVTLPQQLAVGARHYTQITHTSLHTNHAHVTTHKSRTLLHIHACGTQNVCHHTRRFIKFEAATGQTHYRRQFEANGTTALRNVQEPLRRRQT